MSEPGQVGGEHQVERVALALGRHQLLDILVAGVDFVDELRYIHVALGVLRYTLVERLLQFGILRLELGIVGPGLL